MQDATVIVAFNPDGTVCSIGKRPERASPQQWFDHLNREAPEAYLPLSGGRASFRLDAPRLRALTTPWETNHVAQT